MKFFDCCPLRGFLMAAFMASGWGMASGLSTASSTMKSANGATHGIAARTGMSSGWRC